MNKLKDLTKEENNNIIETNGTIIGINEDGYTFEKDFLINVFAKFHDKTPKEIKNNYIDKFEEKLFNLCFVEMDNKYYINKYYWNRMKVFNKDFMTYLEDDMKGFL